MDCKIVANNRLYFAIKKTNKHAYKAVRVTVLQWKSNNALFLCRWVTRQWQQYKNIEYCATMTLRRNYVVYRSSNKPPDVCQILTKFVLPWETFTKVSNIKFHGNPSSGSRADTCWQTSRRTKVTNLSERVCTYFAEQCSLSVLITKQLRNLIIWHRYIFGSGSTIRTSWINLKALV